MRCSFLYLVFLCSLIYLPCCYSTTFTLADESNLNDSELEEDLKNYNQYHDKLIENLVVMDDKQQLNQLLEGQKLIFDKFSNVDSLLMTGLLGMLINPDAESNNHLDHACAQYHIPSLIVRGLHSIHLYNKNADFVLLQNACNDLRVATQGYIYWRSLTFNGHFFPEEIELPSLDEFDDAMKNKLENNREVIELVREKRIIKQSKRGLYTGFLRKAYINRKESQVEEGTYQSVAIRSKSPLGLFKPERITRVVHDALKTIFPLPEGDLKRNEFWITLALAGFRESLCCINRQVGEEEVSVDDIYLAYFGTFLERQSIEQDKNFCLSSEKSDFFQTLYNQSLEPHDRERKQGGSQYQQQNDKKIAKLFKRMEQELAGLRLQLNSFSEPPHVLSFTSWIIQALQKQYGLFDFAQTMTAAADVDNAYQSALNTANDDDNQKEPLYSGYANKECGYNSSSLIHGLANNAEGGCSFARDVDLESQNSGNRASLFSRCCQWAVNNPGKAVCCSLVAIGAVAGLAGFGRATLNKLTPLPTSETLIPNSTIEFGRTVFNKPTLLLTSETPTPNSTIEFGPTVFNKPTPLPTSETSILNSTIETVSARPQSSCRPFTEYDKVGYLVFSGDLIEREISDYTATDGGKAVNEAAYIQKVLARELAPDAQLVVYSSANSTTHIQDKFEPLVGKDRLHIIKTEPAVNKFWSRDCVPVPVYDAAAKGGFKLIDAPYRYYKNGSFFPYFQQDALFSDYIKVPLVSHFIDFQGGNLLADSRGNCAVVDSGVIGQTSGIDNLFTRFYCCKEVLHFKHLVGIGHIDEVVKIIDDLNVLTDQPSYVQKLQNAGYNVTLMPEPQGEYATYLNAFIMNGKVFVPVYDQETDQQAINIYKSFGLEVHPLPSTYLSRNGHGSIHCTTMAFPPRN